MFVDYIVDMKGFGDCFRRANDGAAVAEAALELFQVLCDD
jgi:hypothetical protein